MGRPRLIKGIINAARNAVFNNMPIRLLMFDQNGKGIKLVERSELMEYISSEINSVTDLRHPYHHSFEKYATLSHTWLPRGEVTYSEWRNHTALLDIQSHGYNKLAKFCEVAATYGLRLGWMDTVCINKESSSELDESIRSMFKWYQRANICIAYLAETASLDDMEKDKWFTRGWTLQELLAPNRIKFFSKSWTTLSSPADYSDKLHGPLATKIRCATGLYEDELSDFPVVDDFPIWRKMQWAANREVTREEDTAYSLMGIFNISMPTGYGEGAEYAFLRLVKEILNAKSTSISKLEIANWNSGLGSSSHVSSSTLIPRGPRAYMQFDYHDSIHFYSPSSPITLSHMGLCIPVLLMPFSIVQEGLYNGFVPKGNYSATFANEHDIYQVLDGSLFGSERSHDNVCIFAVLNIADRTTEVLLPDNYCCLAKQFWACRNLLEGWEILEDRQLKFKALFTFDIKYHNNSSESFRIPKDKLKDHGMTLHTMHL